MFLIPTRLPLNMEFKVQSRMGRDVTAMPLTLVPVRNFLRRPVPLGIKTPQIWHVGIVPPSDSDSSSVGPFRYSTRADGRSP